MTEILEIQERIQLAVKIGESHYREFKSAMEGHPQPKEAEELEGDLERRWSDPSRFCQCRWW